MSSLFGGNRDKPSTAKLISKILDQKKDALQRVKYIKQLIDSVDPLLCKSHFEERFSLFYCIVYDAFIVLETKPIKKEEFDLWISVFERCMTMLPELVACKWQYNSILLVMKKLLHPANHMRIRKEGVRLFLIWYQILYSSKMISNEELDSLFQSLVPGLFPDAMIKCYGRGLSAIPPGSIPNEHIGSSPMETPSSPISSPNQTPQAGTHPHPYDPHHPPPLSQQPPPNMFTGTNSILFNEYAIEPFISWEAAHFQNYNDVEIIDQYLKYVLHQIVQSSLKIFWRESTTKQYESFLCLFEKFKQLYIYRLFPSLQKDFSLYDPIVKLPEYKPIKAQIVDDFSITTFAQVYILRWFIKYLRMDTGSDMQSMAPHPLHAPLGGGPHHPAGHSPAPSSSSDASSLNEWHEPSESESNLVRSAFCATRDNCNLIHQLLRESYLLPFIQPCFDVMKQTTIVYRDWIYRGPDIQNDQAPSIPCFLREPEQNTVSPAPTARGSLSTHPTSVSDERSVRAGHAKVVQVFLSSASNIFIQTVPERKPLILEEQMEMCKRVLNIFRYLVMKIDMNRDTWEQLLVVLLGITKVAMTPDIPARKEDTLGGRLAPALFQTLIVTWIKANLNIHVSANLWEDFHAVIYSLIKWEELIVEWRKTMETLTRVMVKHNYNISLNDLPLERQTDRRQRAKSVRNPLPSDIKQPQTNEMKQLNIRLNQSGLNSSHNPPSNALSQSQRDSPSSSSCGFHKRIGGAKQLSRSNSDSSLYIIAKEVKVERWRSLIALRSESPSSPNESRSASPSPSAHTSLKEDTIQLDEGGSGSMSSSPAPVSRSVIAGGAAKGWSPESSMLLWRRMLAVLGDINSIPEPQIHYQVLECLAKITEDLMKVRENIGLDDVPTTRGAPIIQFPLPALLPPLDLIMKWLFQTGRLPLSYNAGKLLALKLICLVTCSSGDASFSNDYLALFYETILNGLRSGSMDMISAILKNCGPRYFSSGHRGFLIPLPEFVNGINAVLSETETIGMPRSEALSTLGALIGLETLIEDFSTSLQFKDLKNFLIDMLLKSSRSEHTAAGRCVALSSLGIYVYQQLANHCSPNQLGEAVRVLVSSTRFPNRTLARVACDQLRLISDHASQILEKHGELPRIIIEGLALSIYHLLVQAKQKGLYKEHKNIIISDILCLGEWMVKMPHNYLKFTMSKIMPKESILSLVIRILSNCMTNAVDDELSAQLFPVRTPNGNHAPPVAGQVPGQEWAGGAGTPHSPNASQNVGGDFGFDGVIFNIASDSSSQELYPSPKKRLIDTLRNRPSGPQGTMQQPTGQHPFSPSSQNDSAEIAAISLSAKMMLSHLLAYVGHFPFMDLGPENISCFVNESHDNKNVQPCDELKLETLMSPSVLLFSINDSKFISLMDTKDGSARIIVRDLIGKFGWDFERRSINASIMALNWTSMAPLEAEKNLLQRIFIANSKLRESMEEEDDDDDGHPNNVGRKIGSLRPGHNHRQENKGHEPNQDKTDYLEDVLNEMSVISPECNSENRKRRQLSSNQAFREAEESMMALLSHQHFTERSFIESEIRNNRPNRGVPRSPAPSRTDRPATIANGQPPTMNHPQLNGSYNSHHSWTGAFSNDNQNAFVESCQLLSNLDYFTWGRRKAINVLRKSEQLLRDLKSFDSQRCRETHKIAVIYVARGQEEKQSILLNKIGSKDFEDFVAGLGWEVDLSTHTGYRGGLQSNLSTGKTAPYYATSLYEVMYHVSTRMPASAADEESLNRKLRHLGNDEVHVVYSEHTREYRRSIIATEFCDVLIVIYPIARLNGQFARVSIFRKPEVPFFGPLFNNCIVHRNVLPGLVRATAINASRAKRLHIPYYKNFFEERQTAINEILKRHSLPTSFEEFAGQIII